jgi:endonuclease YncB( thermonuclease family)
MKASKTPLRLLLLFAGLLLFIPIPVSAGSFDAIRVLDGDNIEARDPTNKKVTIRLAGIDAPKASLHNNEAGQPFHQQAAVHLSALVLNRTFNLTAYGFDSSGRILAEVFMDNKNINLEMVRDGFAEVYRGRPVRGQNLELYWKAEEQARNVKRGIWSQGDRYVSPREWIRKQQH